jgi:predicted nucleotidyltransferase
MSAQLAVPFDPLRGLATLHRHGVRFVIIGGIASRLHGSPSVTRDLDICYARDAANLEALAAALVDLHARLRGVAEEVPFRLDAQTLHRGDSFTFATDAGDLDVLGTPSGTAGYEELARTADDVEMGSLRVKVASLDAIIAMKRAAGRPRDRVEVEILEALRDEIDSGG